MPRNSLPMFFPIRRRNLMAAGEGGGAPLVLVTGASGFLASHIVRQLLEAGYRVRGTVRDPSNDAKTAFLKGLPHADERLELVRGDLTSDEGWEEAMEGVKYVLHTASPFPLASPRDEMELITPAVEGTKRVLGAAIKAKIGRVVLTSSFVAVGAGYPHTEKTRVFTSKDWSNLDSPTIAAYEKSKTLAEKAAWDIVKDTDTTLAVVNPTFITGPTVSKDAPVSFTSAEVISKIVEKEFPGIPQGLSFLWTDVRDTARAHIRAMVVPEAAGERFIMTDGLHSLKEMAEAIDKAIPQLHVPTNDLPDWQLWIASWFDSGAAAAWRNKGLNVAVENNNVKEILGIECRPTPPSAAELALSLCHAGVGEKVEGLEDRAPVVKVDNLEQIKL